MATQAQADKARAEHANRLAQQGAHSVGVEEGGGYGHAGYVVSAYVAPDRAVDLPASLALQENGRKVEVPLVVKRAEMFRPE